jgi:hypothetical protein
MRQYLYAVVLLLFCGVASPALTAPIGRDLVPDPETAIKVATAILEAWMGEGRFADAIKDAPLRAKLVGERWYVSPSGRDTGDERQDPPGTVTVQAGGGQVVIVLSRKDAQVVDIFYAR